MLAVLVMLMSVSSSALEPISCQDIFTQYQRVILKSSFPVKDQGCVGNCGFAARVSDWEIRYELRTGEPLELSSVYPYLQSIARKAAHLNGRSFMPAAFFDGGDVGGFSVIPESQFQPKWKFWLSQTETDKFFRELQKRLFALPEFKPRGGRAAKAWMRDYEVRVGRQQKAWSVVKDLVGNVKDQFLFKGRTYTDEQFTRQVLEAGDRVSTWENEDAAVEVAPDKPNREVIERITQMIDNGEPVFASMLWDPWHVSGGGLVTHRFFFAAPPRDLSANGDGHHAVLFVGYRRNLETQEIDRLIIRNSWGHQVGDQGYFHLDTRSFGRFISKVELTDTRGLPEYHFRLFPDQINQLQLEDPDFSIDDLEGTTVLTGLYFMGERHRLRSQDIKSYWSRRETVESNFLKIIGVSGRESKK